MIRPSAASVVLGLLAAACAPTCALAGQANDAATAGLVAVPAMHVPHSSQAMNFTSCLMPGGGSNLSLPRTNKVVLSSLATMRTKVS